MKSFDCDVVDRQGKKHRLQRSAPGEDWILRDLNAEGYFILGIRESGEGSETHGETLSLKTVIEFTQTLGTLMGNGLTLKETLKVATEVFPNPNQQRLFRRINDQVSKGDSLYQSLIPWKKSFPPLYLGLIKIGEKTGDLSSVLNQLGEYLQTRKALKDKTGNALVYPLFVLGVAVVGLVLLMVFVVPTLTAIIANMNAKAAEAYTENIRGFQTMAGILGLILLVALGALAGLIWRRSVDPVFRQRYDGFLTKVPLLKNYLFAHFGLNFSFAVETLLAAGYPLEEALHEGAQVVTNTYLKTKIVEIRDQVLKGSTLSKAFRRAATFPESLVGWIAVGEGAHDLGKSFGQLRRFYQQELTNYNQWVLNLVEPALIVMVGLLLIFLILTFIIPMFSMLGTAL